MPQVRYQGVDYVLRPGETVLELMLRQGVDLPFSCRNGICQVCLRRCESGEVPETAQAGLRPGLRRLGYFLPCKCRPEGDIAMAPPRDGDLYSPAVVHAKELLGLDVCRLLLEPATSLYYHPGQFINLRRPDGLCRSYSLASVPAQDYFLDVHVKRLPGGRMSRWLHDELQPGDELEIQGPNGAAYYSPAMAGRPLLLIGTGTGLSPLLGIARDALASGHAAPIHLYHGSRYQDGLYHDAALRRLMTEQPQFHYHPCVSGRFPGPLYQAGRAHDLALREHPALQGWCVVVAGLPAMVQAASAQARAQGADLVLADPFDDSGPADLPPANPRYLHSPGENTGESCRQFPPDPEMWSALHEGRLMESVLTDFYTRAFEDPILAPYFHNVTRQRLIEKVFSFMRQIFTGERLYFGDRPRNAHHWMVIPETVFAHREALMAHCLRAHGLAEPLVARWLAIEQQFKGDIVKDRPWGRVIGGVEQPVEGYGELTLDVGTLCDACGAVLEPGTLVRYHLRIGSTYCPACASLPAPAAASAEACHAG